MATFNNTVPSPVTLTTLCLSCPLTLILINSISGGEKHEEVIPTYADWKKTNQIIIFTVANLLRPSFLRTEGVDHTLNSLKKGTYFPRFSASCWNQLTAQWKSLYPFMMLKLPGHPNPSSNPILFSEPIGKFYRNSMKQSSSPDARIYNQGQPRALNQMCHYPHSHEPVFQHDPRQQEDKGFVTTEQSGDIRGCQLL